MVYSIISLQKEVIFINKILDEMEKLISLNENNDIIKLKLSKLWDRLYLLEERKKIREKIKDDFELIERINDLELKPFYYIEQNPSLSKPNTINLSEYGKNILTDDQIVLFLENMLYDVRMKIKGNRSEKLFLKDSLTSYCIFASNYLLANYHTYFNGLNICKINIPYLIPSIFGHYIVIVNFNSFNGDKTYIIDPTYRQFCLLSLCNKNRIYHYDLSTAPGYFAKDKNVIKQLLKNGYIELNEYNCKIYCDSFVLAKESYDNKKIILESCITGKEYVKSLMCLEPIKK